MKTLPVVKPTSEQLPLILNSKPGVMLIRGAAGSGKTSTALLRLKQQANYWLSRRERLQQNEPVKILVITFNRTLRGYVSELADQQIPRSEYLELTVSTFSKWAKNMSSHLSLMDDSNRQYKLRNFANKIDLPKSFVLDEVDYVLSRFMPDHLDDYLLCSRDGRGLAPRVEKELREKFLSEVITPYNTWKLKNHLYDWNDLPSQVISITNPSSYQVIIADEAQDLSANEVRALMHFAAEPSSVTFVIDAAQRIYPRGFTWKEAGIIINSNNSHRLLANHRNTIEICQFAAPLLSGIEIGDDGTFPDFNSCQRHGPLPLVLKGRYSEQVEYAINYLHEHVDLSSESVAFLKPKGGVWFNTLQQYLDNNSLEYVMLSRQSEWPEGTENIALSTMHSAKGLEFDHVIVLGLNQEVTPHGADPNDSALINLRRLLAMALTRARISVIVGYKPSEASALVTYMDKTTYSEIVL